MVSDRARPGVWRRRFFILAIFGAIAGVWWSVSESYLGASGQVAGTLVEISSLSSGRVLETYVSCNEHVELGQPVARVENDARALSYLSRLNELREQSAEADFGLDRLLLEVEEAAARLEEQRAIVEERRANWEAHDRLYDQGVVTKVAWSRARADLKRAEAQLVTAETQLRNKHAEYDSAETLALSRSDGRSQEMALLDNADELRGEVVLSSPVSGIVFGCEAAPGEVVLAGDPLFEIFDPNTAFIRAYIDENDVARLGTGDLLDARLVGYERRFRVTVESIEPRYDPLPEEFRKYFWQDPSWSLYASARLDLNLDAIPVEDLRLGAKVELTRIDPPSFLKRAATMMEDLHDDWIGDDQEEDPSPAESDMSDAET